MIFPYNFLNNSRTFRKFFEIPFLLTFLAKSDICVNKYLLRDLIELGIWSEETKNDIIRNQGSVQSLSYIPKFISMNGIIS